MTTSTADVTDVADNADVANIFGYGEARVWFNLPGSKISRLRQALEFLRVTATLREF